MFSLGQPGQSTSSCGFIYTVLGFEREERGFLGGGGEARFLFTLGERLMKGREGAFCTVMQQRH